MKIEELSFPVTLEAFVAYQEAGAGRELSEDERGMLAAWLPGFNNCYAAGADGDAGYMHTVLDRAEACISQKADGPVVTRILESMRWWMRYAYKQGQNDAGKGEPA